MRILFATFCVLAFVVTWFAMNSVTHWCLVGVSYSGTTQADRVQIGLQQSISGEMPFAATVLCTLNALTQYGLRHFLRRLAEEDDPNPARGFRWTRALQSVLIAWGIWYVMLICHCLSAPQ